MKTRRKIVTPLLAAVFAVSASATVSAQSGSRYQPPRKSSTYTQSGSGSRQSSTVTGRAGSQKKMMDKTVVGLEGYCPVCIVDARKWEKGVSRIQSTFDGVTYYFPSTGIKAKFDRSPERYVPALKGDCIVCLEKAGKRVPGSVRFAALHNDRLYLFPSDKEKKVFTDNPKAYANTDLAVNGECIVCLVKANKHVPGVAKHTVIHEGMRYLFPSDREAATFKANPKEFLSATMKMKEQMKKTIKTGMKDKAAQTVSVVGRSGCAGCEFGVHPVGAPDELGLAIVSKDGKVTVVENAHRDYPEIYKQRFKEVQLIAQGSIIRQEGRITWITPSSLETLQ